MKNARWEGVMRMLDDDEQEMEVGGCPGTEVWRVRRFGEKVGDFQMVTGWRDGHGVPVLPETIIPPLALISECDGEAMAFAVCYQSYGIGVCFLEWLTTRPGIPLKDARVALEHVIRALAECTKETHGLMFGYCVPALAREAKRLLNFMAYDMPHIKLATRID
jgi:hypothetical protein